MTVSPRTSFVLQLLDKLGTPLLRSILVQKGEQDESGVKDAQAMASLLAQAIKVSITIAQAMNLKPEDGDANAIRVALAAIAGELIADYYETHGRMPGDAEGRRIFKSLEAVLTFADNFAPAAEHAGRLETLESKPVFLDPAEVTLYTMRALVPVITAVGEFSFGQPESKLIQDIATALQRKAMAMVQVFGSMTAQTPSIKLSELIVLQALAEIYGQVHRIETARLQAQGEGVARGQPSMETVWAAFERRREMMDVLMHTISQPSSMSSAQGASSSGVRPVVQEQPIEPPPSQPAAPLPSSPPPAAPPATGGETGAPSNPMSYFKKK